MNLKPIRRRLYQLTRVRLPLVAAILDPGARVRLWDSNWNLIADSDHGEHVHWASLDADDVGRLVYEPSKSIRFGGHKA